MGRILNISYSGLHSFYWMIYGVFFSFASVFLLGKGYTNSKIGMVLALGNIMAIILQPIVSDIADRSRKISLIQIIIVSMIIMFISIVCMNFAKESLILTLFYVVIIGIMMMVQPLINALSFTLQESGYLINFGLSRSIGSLGYAILCPILGVLTEKNGVGILPYFGMITAMAVIIILLFTNYIFIKAKRETHIRTRNVNSDDKQTEKEMTYQEKENINWKIFISRHKMFLMVNLGIFGVFMSNQIINGFMLQIVRNINGNGKDMSILFSVIAALEIPTMMFFYRLQKRFSCEFMLSISVICFSLQMIMYFISQNVIMLYLGVAFQPFAFALMLPSIIHLIDEIMNKGEAVKGQSVYVMTTIIASIVATMIGGVVIDVFGVRTLLMGAVFLTVIGAVIVILSLKKIEYTK